MGTWETIHALLATPLYSAGGSSITVLRLLTAVATAAGAILAGSGVRSVIHGALRTRGAPTTTASATATILRWLTMVTGFVVALQIAGFDLSTLFAAGAVLTVGFGFAMQNIAQNFVSGIILFAERSIRPGNVLLVEGRMVRIEKIGIRSTIARTHRLEEIIIPNTTLVQSTVINYTMSNTKYLLEVPVGVSYDSDLDQVQRVLEETAAEFAASHGWSHSHVLLNAFGDSAVAFLVRVESDDPWQYPQHTALLHHQVWRALHAHHIVIAYPQLDVHLHPQSPTAAADGPLAAADRAAPSPSPAAR